MPPQSPYENCSPKDFRALWRNGSSMSSKEQVFCHFTEMQTAKNVLQNSMEDYREVLTAQRKARPCSVCNSTQESLQTASTDFYFRSKVDRNYLIYLSLPQGTKTVIRDL